MAQAATLWGGQLSCPASGEGQEKRAALERARNLMGELEGFKGMYRRCPASGDRQERRKGNSYGSLSSERRAESAKLHGSL